ncbi:hypothetical protein DFH27DRAFT_642917 [Peziza echinospora]|nr:hypothetical protein DFH27DRAFT_642917 [Peziza echinospora]
MKRNPTQHNSTHSRQRDSTLSPHPRPHKARRKHPQRPRLGLGSILLHKLHHLRHHRALLHRLPRPPHHIRQPLTLRAHIDRIIRQPRDRGLLDTVIVHLLHERANNIALPHLLQRVRRRGDLRGPGRGAGHHLGQRGALPGRIGHVVVGAVGGEVIDDGGEVGDVYLVGVAGSLERVEPAGEVLQGDGEGGFADEDVCRGQGELCVRGEGVSRSRCGGGGGGGAWRGAGSGSGSGVFIGRGPGWGSRGAGGGRGSGVSHSEGRGRGRCSTAASADSRGCRGGGRLGGNNRNNSSGPSGCSWSSCTTGTTTTTATSTHFL